MTATEQMILEEIRQLRDRLDQLVPMLTGQLSISVETAPPPYGSFAQRLADCMAIPKRKSPQRRVQS